MEFTGTPLSVMFLGEWNISSELRRRRTPPLGSVDFYIVLAAGGLGDRGL